MERVARNEHFPYEQEHIGGDLLAVRGFLDGCTYRVLYAREGTHDQILLGLHVFQKKDRKLPDGRAEARRAPRPRLARTRGLSHLYRSKPMRTLEAVTRSAARVEVMDVATQHDDLDAFIEEQTRDQAFAAAFEDAQARAELLASCVRRRKETGLTQAEVARSMGTTQSAVSDLEAGATDPRLSTLQRYARAVGARIDVALGQPMAAR